MHNPHDLAFLAYLYEQAEHAEQKITYRELEWSEGWAGAVTTTLPEHGAPVKARLGALKQHLQQARRHYEQRDDRQWRSDAEAMVVQLRKAWERAVEQHLLFGVVQRHIRGVQTQKVSKIKIFAEDVAELDRAMVLLSGWGPHDGSAAMNPAVPTPDELHAEIQALASWYVKVDPSCKPKH